MLRQDLRYGARMLWKRPGFTAVAVLSLAVGIGAASTVFSVINAVLLRPLPYRDAERLVILWNRSPGLNIEQDWFSPGQYLDVKADNRVFEETAVAIGGSFNLTGQGGQAGPARPGGPEHVDGARISSSFLPLLGVKAARGRLFLAEEDQPGKPVTVILSHGFWQRRFGADPSVIGRNLILNGNNFEIVGILPAGFVLTKEVLPAVNGIEKAELFLPLPMAESARSNRGNEDYNIFARLKPGATVAQAQADLDLLAARMKQQYPAVYPPHGGLTLSVVPLHSQVAGEVGQTLPLLFGAVGLVLLIACANVASLLLARAAARRKEMAIRAAMGAGRARIIRQLLTESMLLSVFGGLLGLLLASITVEALHAFGPENIPRLDEVDIDGRVAIFTCLTALVTGILFGLAPARRASRVDLQETLKEGGRDAGRDVERRGLLQPRNLLVITEIALSIMLLIGAGLLIRSYRHILDAHPGFNPHHVLAMRLSLPAVKYGTPESIMSFYRRMTERVRALPGAESAAVTYSLPMSTVAFAWEPITVEGYVPRTPHEATVSNVRIVSPDYFQTMSIPLLAGRYFTDQDTKDKPETVIVDEALAQRFWPGESPLGKRLRKRDETDSWRTVIGVIRGAKQYSSEKEPPITVYFPHEQYLARSMYLVARTTPDPDQMVEAITRAIQTVDPEMPVFDVGSMEQRLSDSLARRRFSMLLLGSFAALAVLLAAIGIYGVVSYSVAQRAHEIGIRMALGAQMNDVLRLVVGAGMKLTLIGVGCGLAGALLLTRLMSGLLFGVGARDPMTFITVALILSVVALLACYLPARRATRVDPMAVLRTD